MGGVKNTTPRRTPGAFDSAMLDGRVERVERELERIALYIGALIFVVIVDVTVRVVGMMF